MSSSATLNIPLVVLIEDDATQAELLQAAIEEAGLRVRIQVLGDGDIALARLREWSKPENKDSADVPRLVVLDVKLPKLTGPEILKALRTENITLPFPIVMLTSSRLPDDVVESFSSGALSYFVKPYQFGDLVTLMDTIGRRWLDARSA